MNTKKIAVREGRKEDLPAVLDLIKELAAYERAAQEVINTEAKLQEDFEAGRFKLWVAVDESDIVGMALCYERYSTWKGRCLYLEDIVVRELYRRCGIGSRLFSTLIEYAKAKGYYSLNWQVLDWNEPALNFYKKWKAEIDTTWWNGKIVL